MQLIRILLHLLFGVFFFVWIALVAYCWTNEQANNILPSVFIAGLSIIIIIVLVRVFVWYRGRRREIQALTGEQGRMIVKEEDIDVQRGGECGECKREFGLESTVQCMQCSHEFHEECFVRFQKKASKGDGVRYCPQCMVHVQEVTLYRLKDEESTALEMVEDGYGDIYGTDEEDGVEVVEVEEEQVPPNEKND